MFAALRKARKRRSSIGKGARTASFEQLEARELLTATAQNIILMVNDGQGFNGWEAARYYEGGLPYDDAGFRFYGMSTYMQNVFEDIDGNPVANGGYRQDSAGQNWVPEDQGYDPGEMWEDFNYHRGDRKSDYTSFTGSAAAATAMYTGSKTYRGAISYDAQGNELTTIAEIASDMGKATGAVSSVQLSHATPACVDAHHHYRSDYPVLGDEMIYDSDLDVIMGAGDGDVGWTGYVGGDANWEDVKGDNSNGNDPDGPGANGFTYIADVADFQALADGSMAPPSKLLGIPHVGGTLNDAYKPGTNDESVVPTLETMTKGAINVLSQDPDGFFLVVEGGAVDWENHANDADAMMAEQVDFDNSVQAVMDWIANGSNGSNWGNTLLIVTADHETGGIWGPGTLLDDGGTPSDGSNGGTHLDDEINDVWQNVVDNGPGNMPGFQYTTGGHTNVLVPLWAKGKGSELFHHEVVGNDATANAFWSESQGWKWRGDYVDNTAVFRVMDTALKHPKLRGGKGPDTFKGHEARGRRIGDETVDALNHDALLKIMSRWSGPSIYSSRIAARPTGNIALNSMTASDDDARDRLFGGFDSDWSFAGLDDDMDDRFWEEVH